MQDPNNTAFERYISANDLIEEIEAKLMNLSNIIYEMAGTTMTSEIACKQDTKEFLKKAEELGIKQNQLSAENFLKLLTGRLNMDHLYTEFQTQYTHLKEFFGSDEIDFIQ